MLFWTLKIWIPNIIFGMMEMVWSKWCCYSFKTDDNCLIFRGNENVTLFLSYNIVPNAGLLPNIIADGSHQFKFPVEYTSSRM